MTGRSPLRTAGVYAALLTASVFFAAPFAWMILTSLKQDDELFRRPVVWVPAEPQWQNYGDALRWGGAGERTEGQPAAGILERVPFLRYTWNTAVLTFWCVLGTLASCSLAAYGFARLKWRGRDTLFFILLATMMLPGLVTLIPVLLIFKSLGWVGTILPLVVPAFLGPPFYVFLLRQFFLTIPQDLSEAARIDGCSEFGIYGRVVLPLAKPALSVVALFVFVNTWNDFLGPLIYLSTESQYTLSLGLQMFLSQHGAEWQKLMAASTLMILPVLAIFLAAQRAFVEGISVTGLKG